MQELTASKSFTVQSVLLKPEASRTSKVGSFQRVRLTDKLIRWLFSFGWSKAILFLLTLSLINQTNASTLTDFDGATFYKAPVGSRIRIACNGSHWNEDSVSLVLWFKGTIERHSSPIYTVDARQRPLNSGARHLVSDSLKGRARFVTKSSPPYLDLAPLEEEDQSEYRCRIDYRSRPRENFLIILFVIVPPKSVQIVDSNGRSLEQIYGPLSEGSDLTLLCLSKGGRPAPSLTWRRRAKVIDDSYLTLSDFLALKQSDQLVSLANGRQTNSSESESASASSSSSSSSEQLNRMQQLQARDNNQSSINQLAEDPSLGNLADSSSWRDWPEFSYYERNFYTTTTRETTNLHRGELTGSSPVNSIFPEGNNSNRQNVASGQMLSANNHLQDSANQIEMNRKQVFAATGSGGGSRQTVASEQQTATSGLNSNLLTLTVHESINTAVNVLHLSNAAALFEHRKQHFSQQTTTVTTNNNNNYGQQQQQDQLTANSHTTLELESLKPELECHASNLHYDLRALIKLFAPPSLVGASSASTISTSSTNLPAQMSSKLTSSKLRPIHNNESSLPLLQFLEASELALESSFRTNGEWLTTTSNQQQQQPKTSANDSMALANKQVKQEAQDYPPELGSSTNNRSSNNNNNNLHFQEVVYQQLFRPHQLALEMENQMEKSIHSLATTASDQSLTRSKLISLDVYLRPLDVKITSQQRPLSAGQLAEFTCTASGSRPAAALSWLKNGRLLDSSLSRHLEEGSVSHSKLSLHLEQQDHGSRLVCRAENELLTKLLLSQHDADNSTLEPLFLEDSRILTVHYPPKAKLELGSKVLSSAVREGADIYFVCLIDSVPPVREISWLHNEQPLVETTDTTKRPLVSGLIMSNNSLVLQRVRLEQRGNYACVASNSEGVSESNRIELRVLHAPICVSTSLDDQQQQSSTSRELEPILEGKQELLVASRMMPLQARANFLCKMMADPSELEVTWYLNNSQAERRVLFSGRVQSATREEKQFQQLNRNNKQFSKKDNSNNDHDDDEEGEDSQRDKQETTSRVDTSGLVVVAASQTRDKYRRWQESDQSSVHKLEPGSRLSSARGATSQLTYLVDTSLDYGRLYCVAKNSIGEQRRACVYEIQEPGGLEELAEFNCLAVNVTSVSVWIGCGVAASTGSSSGSGGMTSAQDEQMVDSIGQHRFSIELYSLKPIGGQSEQYLEELKVALEEDWPAASGAGQLEANLTSAPLDEPLFSLNNLRPETSYIVHVFAYESSLSSLDIMTKRKPSVVRFSTSRRQKDNNNEPVAQFSKPTIEPIDVPHPSNLLSTLLLSTRSTNGHQTQTSSSKQQQLLNSSGRLMREHPIEQAGYLRRAMYWISSSLFSLSGERQKFQAGGKQVVAGGNSVGNKRNNNQLMEIPDAFLIASLCFLLLASLTILLFIHRYSGKLCLQNGRVKEERRMNRNQKSSTRNEFVVKTNRRSSSSSTTSSSGGNIVVSHHEHKHENENVNEKQQLYTKTDRTNQSSGSNTRSSTIDQNNESTTTANFTGSNIKQQANNGLTRCDSLVFNNPLPRYNEPTNHFATLDSRRLRSGGYWNRKQEELLPVATTTNSTATTTTTSYIMEQPNVDYSASRGHCLASNSPQLATTVSSTTTTCSGNNNFQLAFLPTQQNLYGSGNLHAASDIGVTKSRSSLCLGSQILTVGPQLFSTTTNNNSNHHHHNNHHYHHQQQQQQQQQRLIQFNDIEEPSISDANMQLELKGELQIGQEQQGWSSCSYFSPDSFNAILANVDQHQTTMQLATEPFQVDLTNQNHFGQQKRYEQQQQQLMQIRQTTLASNESGLQLEPCRQHHPSATFATTTSNDQNELVRLYEIDTCPDCETRATDGGERNGQVHSGVKTTSKATNKATTMTTQVENSNQSMEATNLTRSGYATLLHGSGSMIGDKSNYTKRTSRQQQRDISNAYFIRPKQQQQQHKQSGGLIKQPTPFADDRQTSSLVSDESSDSNAHCTWSLQNEQVQFETEQMQYIELLTGEAANECMNLKLMNKFLGQATAATELATTTTTTTTTGRSALGINQFGIGDPMQTLMCTSLTSSSIGSSTTKDQIISSPLSQSNTTSSPIESAYLLQNNSNHLQESANGLQRVSNHSRSGGKGGKSDNIASGTSLKDTKRPASILKNINPLKGISRHMDDNICNCIGNDATKSSDEHP